MLQNMKIGCFGEKWGDGGEKGGMGCPPYGDVLALFFAVALRSQHGSTLLFEQRVLVNKKRDSTTARTIAELMYVERYDFIGLQ